MPESPVTLPQFTLGETPLIPSKIQYVSVDGKLKTSRQHLSSDKHEARLFISGFGSVQRPGTVKSVNQQSRVDAVKAFLGNTTKSVNPQPKISEDYYNRYRLQNQSRLINHDKRVKSCCRSMLSGVDSVSVNRSEHGYNYGNIQRCASVWICPVCANHIVRNRRQELGNFIEQVYKSGDFVSMLTLTIPHGIGDDLQHSLDGISNSFKKFQNRKTWKSFKAKYGITGTVRTLEVTYGVNGWHPHFHVLLVSHVEVNDYEIMKLLSMWQSAVISCDMPCPNNYGLDLRKCNKSINDYVQKWGIDFEMVAGNLTKKAGDKGFTPFQLLASAADGNKYHSKLYRQYSLVFHGKRQLVYSEGLKALYRCCEEKTDEELLKDEEQKSEVICYINKIGWKHILDNNIRGDILDTLKFNHSIQETADLWGLTPYLVYPSSLDSPGTCNFQNNAKARCFESKTLQPVTSFLFRALNK